MQKGKIKNQIDEKELIAHKQFYDDDIPVCGEIYFLNTKFLKLDGAVEYLWMDKA